MVIVDVLRVILLVAGLGFFVAGTVGLVRFPDVYTRLHALTKADNLGLGLVLASLALGADSWWLVGKYLLVWLLVLAASAVAACLVARRAIEGGIEPLTRRRP